MFKTTVHQKLSATQTKELLGILQSRFEKNRHRHPVLKWEDVLKKLDQNKQKLWSLFQMEETGGEPDIIQLKDDSKSITFYDCAAESPKDRRSLCYDDAALQSRKANKPLGSAMLLAEEMGVKLLDEQEYLILQKVEAVDNKTSSWLLTSIEIRKKGGAIFGDHRFGRTFIYHNGAESYYSGRGFRSLLTI